MTGFRWLCAASLFANLLLASTLAVALLRPGIARDIRARLHIGAPQAAKAQSLRNRLFTVAPPAKPVEVVFAGDSLTEGGLWDEWLSPVTINRGVSSDSSADLLRRAESLAALRPRSLWLMIGTNDFRQFTPEQTAAHVREIVSLIRRLSPSTQCYVQSILPNLSPDHREAIHLANMALQQQAAVSSYTYVEVAFGFFDATGNPRPELYIDTLHLSAEGYRTWLSALPATLRR